MNNLVFLENIEWFDESGRALVHRIPEEGSGEIKLGAQLTVRESQAAVLFYKGRAYDAYGAGRHTLTTANIPILTKILAIPWGMSSPLRAEVYFANLKVFTNMKWGTRDPVAFRDEELGLIRLRAFGVFDVRVVQPVQIINTMVGTQNLYTAGDIDEYLSRIIVSRFNDYLGENLKTVFDLPGRYEEMSIGLKEKLAEDFSRYGLSLVNLYINSITPPPDVQQAIDDKSRLGVFDDLNQLLKMKAAMALEKASETGGEAAAGMGLGAGMVMPAMFMEGMRQSGSGGGPENGPSAAPCPDCGQPAPPDSRYCPHCGHQLVVFNQCADCGKNMPPNARFCPRCGRQAETAPAAKFCRHCGTENVPESVYCNACGRKL